MFGTIRKHQTWLWAVIITLTIISFVIWFSPYSRVNQSRAGSAYLGSIDGQRITPDDYGQAEREVYLRYFFMSGTFPNEQTARTSGFDPQRETYYRLLLIRKQEELGIHVSSDVIAQTARNMVGPLRKSGIESPTEFVKKILEPRGFQVDDFERFARHELGIQELISTVGMSGKLVTPEEAKALYEREHEELATDAVFFSASNFLASVSATPDAIAQYYTNHLANYRIPERLQVSYVEFPLTNFAAKAAEDMAKMTNLDERIEALYQQRGGTNYYREAKSPEEAKQKIREEARKEFMTAAAQKNAREFATELFNKEPMQAENLATLAKEKGLTVKLSSPFDREEGPQELKVGSDFAKKAFTLSPTNEPYAGPLIGDDAVFVIAYNKQLPSEIPPLDQIRDRVTADYKYEQARLLARNAGQAFDMTLTNGLAQNKTFSNICAEAKVSVTNLPPFSLSTRALPGVEEHINLNQLKQLAFSTSPGKASPFQGTTEGGVVIYVQSKIPLDTAKMKTELPNFVDNVRQTRQSEAFQEWFRKQAERGLRDTPLMWPKSSPALSSGAAKS